MPKRRLLEIVLDELRTFRSVRAVARDGTFLTQASTGSAKRVGATSAGGADANASRLAQEFQDRLRA